jgi:predicted TIM-barrel fold metal-dependent hydrolase
VTGPKPPTFVDADGHVLEHPTGMQEHAPRAFRDRVWHVETDERGREWAVMDGSRTPANFLTLSGTAGLPAEERERARRGELRYTGMRRSVFEAGARLADLDAEGIAASVLYPTLLLAIAGHPDPEFAEVQCRAYNDWLSHHVAEGDGRLFGVAILPQQDLARAAAEIRRAARLPGIVGVLVRPNPSADWKPFSDPVYDPLWTAAAETGLPIGLHPFLDARLPGACLGLRIHRLRSAEEAMPRARGVQDPGIDNVFFTQAIANPFDMMHAMAFLLAGGVCERFPELRFVFLEANGGWLVPWLERLDHHARIFSWDVPGLRLLPSEYFRRQCWISFDPDESTLAFTARSPLCGAERIVWASDFPHPDAKFPGIVGELAGATVGLSPAEQARIAGANAAELYRLSGLATPR